jgi:gliding motility-associatede transport system auxiliary component
MAENKASSHRTAAQFSTDALRVTTAVAAMVGLGLALFALILGMIYGAAAWFFAPYWLAGVGLLAVIFFVVFNFEWLGQVISGRAAMSGLLVAVMCAASVVVWFGTNYFFNYPARNKLARKIGLDPLYYSADLTKTRRFTLNDKTLDLLGGLESKVKITVMWRGGPQEGPQMDSLLECYAEASDMVDLEFLMPTNEDYERKKKKLADRLNKESSRLGRRSVSLLFKDRFKYLDYGDLWDSRPRQGRFGGVQRDRIFKGEEAITSAIYEMIDTEKSKVYFVIDHGEKNPDDSRSGQGLSRAAQLLKRSNIDWEVMDLRTKRKIPDDATVVAVIGPRRELTAEEVKVLQTYLDERQGRLLICMDNYRQDVRLGLGGLLEHVGLVAGRDFVVEKNMDFLWGRMPGLFIGKKLGSQPAAMLNKLREANVQPSFRGARSLRPLQGYRGKFSTHELASASDSDSWGETNLEDLFKRGKTKFDKNSDTEGPIHYAFACYEGPAPMGGRMATPLGRVVVVGDSDWCENSLMDLGDNCTFFMAAINWLAGKEKRISIEPKLADNTTYAMKSKHARRFKIILVIIPVLLALAAGWVFWVRRR